MAEKDVVMSKDEWKIMQKALNALIGSLMRSKTKEGDSEIGMIVGRQLNAARALHDKITQKELF